MSADAVSGGEVRVGEARVAEVRDPAFEWRYTRSGERLHALSTAASDSSLCGVIPGWYESDWRGTGSQKEHDKATSLPGCRKCLAMIDHMRSGVAWPSLKAAPR